jgi:putative transposase
MTSRPVSTLTDLLGVTLSFSRPKVSNDNPYSEALFKTVKYDLAFPETFDSYDDALRYCRAFFTAYNTAHRHSGVGYHTPHHVHHGATGPVTATRRAALEKTWRAHPERHTTTPRPPRLPQQAHINAPHQNRTHLSQTG